MTACSRRQAFKSPSCTAALEADGVLRYGASREEWKATWKQRSLEDPPALLIAGSQLEWLAPDDLENHSLPDYWDPALVFVPFAQTGAGDVWCWYPTSGTEAIVFPPHDEPEGTFIAPHFEGFLLRMLLEAFSEIYPDNSGLTVEECQLAARAEVRTLAPYLRPAWVTLLEELAARPLVEDKAWGCLRLLSKDEAKEIFTRELQMPNLGETFKLNP